MEGAGASVGAVDAPTPGTVDAGGTATAPTRGAGVPEASTHGAVDVAGGTATAPKRGAGVLDGTYGALSVGGALIDAETTTPSPTPPFPKTVRDTNVGSLMPRISFPGNRGSLCRAPCHTGDTWGTRGSCGPSGDT